MHETSRTRLNRVAKQRNRSEREIARATPSRNGQVEEDVALTIAAIRPRRTVANQTEMGDGPLKGKRKEGGPAGWVRRCPPR